MPKHQPQPQQQSVTEVFRPQLQTEAKYQLPLYTEHISAGFPSPCGDWMEQELDLNELVIQHPAATIFVRVSGDSMLKACIHPNDVLVVDQSLEARHGNIVVVALDGELLVKRLQRRGKQVFLIAENDAYAAIAVQPETDLFIWGVVIAVIHQV